MVHPTSMMPTRPMGVAVRYLFRIGGTHFDDVDIGKLEADLNWRVKI
jgi:hypothetical protein